MSRVVKHRSEVGTPQKLTILSSAQVIPAAEEPSTTERLRKANTTIANEVLKQLTSRINNMEEEEDEIYKKRITCNYCLLKSKFNIKGKCVQHSVPSAQNIPETNTAGHKQIVRQVNICIASTEKPQSAPENATKKKSVPVEDVINELLEKLDEVLPTVSQPEDINKPLYEEVALQFQKMLGREAINEQTDCIPITPVTKPKQQIRFQEMGLETPIKITDMSRSHLADAKSLTPRDQIHTPIGMIQEIKKWTNHFYSILEARQIPEIEGPGTIRQDLSAYISIMEDKFYKYALKFQDCKRHIDQLNNKLIGYIELASEQVSDKQIQDDLAFVEKASSMGSELERQPDQLTQKHTYHSSVNLASEELLRMLLVQANSVQGMILELEQSNNELSSSVT